MELRAPTSDLYRDKRVERIAAENGCYAKVKWADAFSVRFTLHPKGLLDRPASTAAHDQVIRELLTLEPDAIVRTARAVYEGLADFEAQAKARLTQTSA